MNVKFSAAVLTSRRDRPVESLLTLGDVAEFLSVSERTVRRLVASGALPSIQLGRRVIRFDPADVRRFLAARKG